MFSIIDVTGVMIRGAAALGFAALCGWSSVLLGTGGHTQVTLSGRGGPAILIGLGTLATIAVVYGIISLSRDTRRRLLNVEPVRAASEDQHAFDPDAIIARHVARLAAHPPAVARRQDSGLQGSGFQGSGFQGSGIHQPVSRRSFGRRAA